MRKVFLSIAVIAISLGSCTKATHQGGKTKKETITSEQTITVKAGETVTIALPTADAHDAYGIITQSTNAASSSIVEYVNYSYTAPATLPIGITTDDIVVSNDHHTYTTLDHVEIPGAVEPSGCPQHYTVKVHVNFNNSK